MNNEIGKKISISRVSLESLIGSVGQFDKNEDENEDPISAYFKQRCGNSSKTYFKQLESDNDSSLGVIDVDNVSLFEEEGDNQKVRLSCDLVEHGKLDSKSDAERKNSMTTLKIPALNYESDLKKQRALAQEALMKLNQQSNETVPIFLTPENTRESNALCDITSTLINSKLSLAKGLEKNLFQPNFSPDTPRYFNDELSSLGTENSNFTTNDTKTEEIEKSRNNSYAKRVNSMMTELSQINLNSDFVFESKTKEEQINRLEEDEEKFKLETDGIMYNSRISQFSGINCECEYKPNLEEESKLSIIGEFFHKRSDRLSSFLGPEVNDHKESSDNNEKESEASTLTNSTSQKLSKNELSLSVCDVSGLEKQKLRRCLSSYDLKRLSVIPKPNTRHSNDSCSSSSTLMIQNLLAEMESGLTGTQIYEKLMNYGKSKIFEKDNKKEPNKNCVDNETPKSSRKKEFTKLGRKEQPGSIFNKEIKNLTNTPTKSLKNADFRENVPTFDLKENLSIISMKGDKMKRLKSKKGFDASTPKLQVFKSQTDKPKPTTGKVLIDVESWEAPRVCSVQPSIVLNKSDLSEENEKTITIVSTPDGFESNKKNGTITINETCTIEDTIIAGDLTVLSQRIEEMKSDGVCIVRSTEDEEPVLLTVVQKLADFPKGSVDCSALTPLLRDQFPELLSTFPVSSQKKSFDKSFPRNTCENSEESLMTLSGNWIQLPKSMGTQDKIYSFTDVEKTISIPLANMTQNWLLMSLEGIYVSSEKRRKYAKFQQKNDGIMTDFAFVLMKDTIIPPNNHQSLQVFVTPKILFPIDIKLQWMLKNLLNGETQKESFSFRIHVVNPLDYLKIVPNDLINFGVISDECFDFRMIQISFDGICELPISVIIPESNVQSQNFILKPCTPIESNRDDSESKIDHTFLEGKKQVLETQVFFQPNSQLCFGKKTQDFCAKIIVQVRSRVEPFKILKEVPIKGSVGFAKFLCNPSCNPLVFHLPDKEESITRLYPLKNVGNLPIAFTVKIMDEQARCEVEDDFFVAPKTFYLSRNEESSIPITFKAKGTENYFKRLLVLQMKPNGKVLYDIALIGVITPTESRPLSQASNSSVSTKSIKTHQAPMKLLTTSQSLSWHAVPLEKESRLSFQLKLISNSASSVRLSFQNNMDSFKLINDNGEKVQKMRKALKPDCPYNVTVEFRPDFIGAHHNAIVMETNISEKKNTILLNGIGGTPNLFIGNVKSDLNGCKILRLINPGNSQFFTNTLEIKNDGRTPGFAVIKSSLEVLSLSNELTITPNCCVVSPNSTVVIRITQKLKSSDIKFLLSGKDICKLATLSLYMGDEHCRLRVKKLIEKKTIRPSDGLKLFVSKFQEEKELNLKAFEDSSAFGSCFLKNTKMIEVAVVIERSGSCEPTVVEDTEETIDEFVTVISAANDPVDSSLSQNKIGSESNLPKTSSECSTTILSSESSSSHCRIAKWLESLQTHSST